MFFLVNIKLTNDNILIPSKWIKKLKTTELLNYGMQYHKNKIYTIFYSDSINNEPRFDLPISAVFDEKKDGCYEGSIIKHFG